jgi:hypothetical protein
LKFAKKFRSKQCFRTQGCAYKGPWVIGCCIQQRAEQGSTVSVLGIMTDSSMLSDVNMDPDIDAHRTDQTRQPDAASADVQQQQQGKQQQQQQQQKGGMWVHVLLPSQLSKGCIPSVSITQSTVSTKSSSAAGKGRQQALPADECLLLLDNAPMQQMQPTGQHLTYWCLGPVETDHWPQDAGGSSSSRRVTRTVSVFLHLPSRGLSGVLTGGRGSKAIQLQQVLLPGCSHQFVLQPCALDNKQTHQTAAAAAAAAAEGGVRAPELAAAMTAVLLQPLQQPQLLPGVVKQLQDLLQHCSGYSSGNSAWGVSDSSSSSGNKTDFVVHTVMLLARQLPTICVSQTLNNLATAYRRRTSNRMDWEPEQAAAAAAAATAPEGAEEDVHATHPGSIQLTAAATATPALAPAPPPAPAPAAVEAATVLQAYAAIRLLSSLSADAIRCLPDSKAQQLQQAVEACLRVLSVLSHAHQLPPEGSSTPTATASSSSNESGSVSWLQQLQQCLRGSLSANAPARALQCCNLQHDTVWSAGLPAFVGLTQQPSLGFLYTLRNLPRQHTNISYSYWQQPTQQQQQGCGRIRAASAAVTGASVGHFADVVLLVCRQLVAISRELLADAASGALLSAVLALAPSLQDLLQLQQQLPPLLQQLTPSGRFDSYDGSRITAAHRIRRAVDAAMQQATVEDLLQWLSCVAAQGLREWMRQAMQQAVVAAVLRMKDSSCSSAAGHGSSNRAGSSGSYLAAAGAAAAPLASAVDGWNNDMLVASPSWDMLCGELLYGGMFEAGPMQLLQQLLQREFSKSSTSSSSSSSCWPPFVSYHLVPAALQQLLSKTDMAAMASAELAAPLAAAAAAAAAAGFVDLAENLHAAQPADGELNNTSEEEQQQQQQQACADGQFDADVLDYVRQWLLRQPSTASYSSTARTALQRSVADLYCAAEQLLQHCPILLNTKRVRIKQYNIQQQQQQQVNCHPANS